VIARAAHVPRNVAREWRMAWPHIIDKRSFLRYGTDAVLSRGLLLAPASNRLRTIQVGGATLTYRLQRGDIQAVREVWVEETYRPPVEIPLGTVVDLGTNIGLTTLWYAVHGASRLRCVEPMPANIALARRNLTQNGFSAELVQAAIGPEDGTAHFHADPRYSTRGHVDEAGELEVPVVSMSTLLADLDRVDLLKVDVEGAEIGLFRAELSWLAKVNAIIIEFDRGDPRELAPLIEAQGFRYVPVGSVFWNSMDFFVRE
jgi:FkbM family methyltransferase